MASNFEQVREFLSAFGHPVNDSPVFCDNQKMLTMKLQLIHEELIELHEGIDRKDMENIAKELTDILYVVYGVGHLFGINLDKCFAKVHASNMTKLGADGKPVYRDDGKIVKGPNYIPPNLNEEVGIIEDDSVAGRNDIS